MKSSLGKRILAPTLTIIAIGLVTTLVVTSLSAQRAAREGLGHRLQRETQLAARLIDNWLQARLIDLSIWSEEEALVKGLTEPGFVDQQVRTRVQRFLVSRQQAQPFYEGIFLANPQGQIIAFSTMEAQPLAHINLMERPYFWETLAGRQVISKMLVSKLSGNKIFVITAPIMVDGEVIGIVGGVIDFTAFFDLFLHNFRNEEHGHAFLTDTQGLILCSSADNEDELARHDDFLRHLSTGKDMVATHRIGDEHILASSWPLQFTDWTLTINQPLDMAFHPLIRAGQISAAAGLAILALIFVLVSALFRRLISTRLRAMLESIARVKEGDLSQRIALPDAKEDEVAELIGSFNEMIGQLEASIDTLNREIQMRKDSEAMLAYHQDHLEVIIAERGRELERAIIERKRVEERLARVEKLEMIGNLAGGVAHDLNNILSGVITYPDLLLLKLPPDSPLAKPLRSIKLSGEKAAAIIQDLLTLARRGASVTKEPVSLANVVDDYLQGPDCKQLGKNRPDIELVSECADDLDAILGSVQPLAKTVANLINNGAESMPNGGRIRLTLTQRWVEAPLNGYEQIPAGHYVVLTVADQGQGIEPHHLARLFEPFYTSKKMGRGGTGLGMAVVWGTLKDHHGYMDCVSQTGKGTTFTLYFPVSGSRTAEDRPALSTKPARADMRGQGEAVLVIDDAEEQRELAALTLAELGYESTVAASGEEGLTLLEHHAFDLILLDMVMGKGMDGLDTYRRIQELRPEQKVIIVSGYSESERLAEVLRLGAQAYLKKPYTLVDLGRTLRHVLDSPEGGGTRAPHDLKKIDGPLG